MEQDLVRFFAVVFLLWSPLRAADTNNPWAQYFPDRTSAPEDERGWAELAKSQPNRVKPTAPAGSEPLTAPPATHTELRPGIDYVRVRQLANDLATIEAALAQPRLIIDLRYVRGELDEARQIGALLARRPLALEDEPEAIQPRGVRAAHQITLCLINRATAGPLEAVLDALQHAGDILLVGTQSAGDTGRFQPAANAPEWRVIVDDFRRAGGPTLLDVGVTPGLFVETSPGIEDAAYLAFDAGRPVADLLDAPVEKTRFDEARLQQHFDEMRPGNGTAPTKPESAAPSTNTPDDEVDGEHGSDSPPASSDEKPTESEDPPPFDRSLQRAVSTLVAQQVLGRTKTDAG